MKKEKVTDERVVAQRRKIQSDAYQILVYCLLASVLIQQFYLKAPLSQFAGEFFCVIGVGLYSTFRSFAEGVDSWHTQTTTQTQSVAKLALNALKSGVIFILLAVFLTGEKDVEILTQIFLAFTVTTFIVKAILQHIGRKKQMLLEKNLDAEEEGI